MTGEKCELDSDVKEDASKFAQFALFVLRISYNEKVEVRRYISVTGRDLVGDWIRAIRDPRAKAAIAIRITRLSFGNAGDSKSVGDGVQELRIDIGVGYRLYYAQVGGQIVLLLCGGDKRRQSTDIMRAKELLQDYKHRSAAK